MAVRSHRAYCPAPSPCVEGLFCKNRRPGAAVGVAPPCPRLGRARSPPPPFRDFIEAESKPWPTSPATPLPPEPSEGPDLWGAVLSFLQYGYVAVVMGLFAYFMVVIERQNEIMESMKSRIAILEVQCRHAT